MEMQMTTAQIIVIGMCLFGAAVAFYVSSKA